MNFAEYNFSIKKQVKFSELIAMEQTGTFELGVIMDAMVEAWSSEQFKKQKTKNKI